MTDIVEFLKNRRSVMARNMTTPAPTQAQIDTLLEIGARVPDHGKLAPWRFLVFENAARGQFDDALARCYAQDYPNEPQSKIDMEAHRFRRAPLIIGVVFSPKDHPKIRLWEQQLSAGAVCQNILTAAQSMGFAAQWLTEWYSYHAQINQVLGLGADEKIAGFIYIGTPMQTPTERARPDIAALTSYWSAP